MSETSSVKNSSLNRTDTDLTVSDDRTLNSRTAQEPTGKKTMNRSEVLSVVEFEAKDRPTFLEAFRELATTPVDPAPVSNVPRKVPRPQSPPRGREINVKGRTRPTFIQALNKNDTMPDDRAHSPQAAGGEVPGQSPSATQVTSVVNFEANGQRSNNFLEEFSKLHPIPDDQKPRLFSK